MTSSTICSHHRIRTVLLMCRGSFKRLTPCTGTKQETRINLNIRNANFREFREATGKM